METRTTLLTLPGEIREHIYEQLLCTDNNYIEREDQDPSTFWTFDLRVYRTCKQIHAEAREVFRRVNTFVKLVTPWEAAVENTKKFSLTPVLCRGQAAESFKGCQMTCTVDAPMMPTDRGPHTFVVDARDVTGFCRMWYYFDISHEGLNAHFGLRMTLAGVEDDPEREVSKTLQTRLFKPWGQVRKLNSLIVEGPHDNDVVEQLRQAMTQPYRSPAECLFTCEMLKTNGNAAFKAGGYSDALTFYQKAFEAIHIVVDGKRRSIWAEGYFDSIITEGRFAGQRGSSVYWVMRMQLIANTIMVYLKIEDYDMAFYWGNRSITLMRQHLGDMADEPQPLFPAKSEWGKIYYRTALAARALGDMANAREMVRVAAKWLPNDAIVQRERADWGNLALG